MPSVNLRKTDIRIAGILSETGAGIFKFLLISQHPSFGNRKNPL